MPLSWGCPVPPTSCKIHSMSDTTARTGLLGAHPHRTLFLAILAIIFVAVLVPDGVFGGHLYDFMVAAVFLAALAVTSRSRRQAFLALAVGVPAVVARLGFSFVDDTPATNGAVLLLNAIFLAYLIWSFLRDLIVFDRETSERVFAALTAYICIGLLFTLIYAHVHYRDPTAFRIPDELQTTARDSESRYVPAFTYFSFVTLTTLGYGDFVPLSEEARTLAWLEAIIGQLYLAVMVGGLVGVFFAEATKQADRASFGGGRDSNRTTLDDE